MKTPAPRYALLDALRGVASIAVLLAHLTNNGISRETLAHSLPHFIREICFEGNFGVQVFFVLSGFVIALSLSQEPLTWPRAVNFIWRRQIRLDPPYCVAMAAMIALHGAFGWGWPTLKTVALNLIYVHNLVGAPQILGVAWTLCLEIQFYVAFLLILGLDRWLKKGSAPSYTGEQPIGTVPHGPISWVASTLVCVTGLISCFLVQIGSPPQLYALGSHSWFYFAAGSLSFWCWRGFAPTWTLGLLFLGMTASALWAFFMREASFVSASFEGIETGIVTTLLLFIMAKRGKLGTITLGRIGQGLGRISYSLYLTHALTVEAVMWTTRAFWGATPLGAISGFVLAFPLAILVAFGFYTAIEKPSVQLAARFK
jgi:peptidoglycan/LPS O-acetylase OafA/YrhL